MLELFSQEQLDQLYRNNAILDKDIPPVTLLTVKKLGYSILIVSLDPEDPHIGYGLCDYDTKISTQHFNIDQLANEAASRKAKIEVVFDYDTVYTLSTFSALARQLGTLKGVANERSAMFVRLIPGG